MAGRLPNHHQLNEMVLMDHPHKSGADLMQNCDLPPPLKVYSGSDTRVITSMNRVCGMMGKEDDDHQQLHLPRSSNGTENETLELLKALRLSQTRAREAERKNELIAKEKDCLSNALIKESLQLFAHRHWVRFLELQILKLETQRLKQKNHEEKQDDEDGTKWILALALCLGVAGVGFAFGCTYTWSKFCYFPFYPY